MKCPQCIKEDKRSTVNQGHVNYTLAYIPIQYDEDGKLMVFPTKNNTTTNYSCSNGHSWSE